MATPQTVEMFAVVERTASGHYRMASIDLWGIRATAEADAGRRVLADSGRYRIARVEIEEPSGE